MKRESKKPLSFLADENFSAYILEVLRVYARKERHTFVAHGDRFARGVDDDEWIAEAGTWKPKPIILGGDGRILQIPAQLEAIQTAGLHFVYLTKGYTNMAFRDQIRRVLAAWQSVEDRLAAATEPTVFRVGIKSVEDVKALRNIKRRPRRKGNGGRRQDAG